jgi:hypothetical protein
MYVTGLHRDTSAPLFVPRNQSDKKQQRKILEGNIPPGSGKKKT